MTQTPLFNYFLFVLAAIMMSVTGAIFFDGTKGEIIASTVAGFLVSIWTVIVDRVFFISSKNLLGVSSAMISGIVGMTFKWLFRNIFYIDPLLVLFSGVYSLLPGMEFIISISELNMRNLLSGMIRLVSTFVSIAQLLFGAIVSARLNKLINGDEQGKHPREEVAPWINALVIPIFAGAAMVQMGISFYPITTFFILIVSFVALFMTNYMVNLFGLEIGMMMGALAVGLIANIYSFVIKRPSLIVSSCGILLLVPSIISADSVQVLTRSDVETGIDSMMQSALTAFALAVGLMFSDFMLFFSDKSL